MTARLPEAAREISGAAAACAQASAEQLLAQHPVAAGRYAAGDPMDGWRNFYYTHLEELATAVANGRPKLFADRLTWARQALDARKLPTVDLLASLQILKDNIVAFTSAESAGALSEYFQFAEQSLRQVEASPTRELDATIPTQRLALDYLACVVEGNVRQAVEMVLERLDDPHSFDQLLLDVLLPAQVEAGRLWHANQLSVAEEHLLTQTTRRVMAVLAHRTARAIDNGKTVLAASVAGNVHELGLQAICYLLEREGWRTLFCGADLPTQELPAAVGHFSANVVLLSASMPAQLAMLRRCVEEVSRETSARVIVGGRAFIGEPDLWKDMGADGYAPDAATLLELVAE